MVCEEKLQLVVDYCAAVAAYQRAVSELERQMIGPSDRYFDNRRCSEEARTVCEGAREELDRHVDGHGC